MVPETDPIQFPRQIWQAVSDQARQCIAEKEFCPEQSRIENLRCVHFEGEADTKYGLQLWYFEAVGVDPIGRRCLLYGALEFSVQYGLLVPSQTALFEDAELRQQFLDTEVEVDGKSVWRYASTRFWVRTACLGVVVTAMMWASIFFSYLIQS